ncbi:hypothetical protein NQZ68_033587 [Dissostichus eleginoides]|nr:hypothetical protein NQZ68_033587 [Dissostichus eleginoides]
MAHFDAGQFVKTKKGKTRLRADAIPTIFVHRLVVKKRRPLHHDAPRDLTKTGSSLMQLPNAVVVLEKEAQALSSRLPSWCGHPANIPAPPPVTSLLLHLQHHCSSTCQHPANISAPPPPTSLLLHLPAPLPLHLPAPSQHPCSSTCQHPANIPAPPTVTSLLLHLQAPLALHLPAPSQHHCPSTIHSSCTVCCVSLRAADSQAGGLCEGPPTQMVASGEITHPEIILETPGEPEEERRGEM